jgi:hypothetical protein
MKRKRSGAKITSQVSADGRAKSADFDEADGQTEAKSKGRSLGEGGICWWDDPRCIEPVRIDRDIFERPWWGAS